MGLQKQIELESGVILPEAYAKVSTFYFYNTSSDNSYVNIEVNIFKDKAARDSGKPEVAKFIHKCNDPNFTEYFSLSVLNGIDVNMISQAYEWMKTMSIYSGSIDIVDSKE
jgi:hypothetical protein